MATAGPNSPGTLVNDSGWPHGTANWVNPGNAGASDNAYASITPLLNNRGSSALLATNFGFSIPAGATVTNITVDVECKVSAYPLDYGLAVGYTINGAANGTVSGRIWPPLADSYQSVGLSVSLTASEVNSVNFGVFVGALDGDGMDWYIDHIRVTLTYAIPALFRRSLLGVGF